MKSDPKEWFKRQARWRHNGFSGSARMMEVQLINICEFKTTTDETRRIANEILKLVPALKESLKTRRPGT